MGNMGSAHPLVEVNVSFKFEGNSSISKGVIERTRIGDGRTDRPTDATKRIQYSPPHILWWGYNKTSDTEFTAGGHAPFHKISSSSQCGIFSLIIKHVCSLLLSLIILNSTGKHRLAAYCGHL